MNNDFVITEIRRIIMVGKEEYPEPHSVFGNHLKNNELIYHFSGKASVHFGEKVLNTAPDTIRFLPTGQVSRYEVFREEAGGCFVIFFHSDRPVADEAFVLNGFQKEKIAPLFQKIFTVWTAREEGYHLECMALLYRIFAEIQKSYYAPGEHKQKIAPALDAIHSGFLSEPLRTGTLAQMCGISESYFKRLFREIYGVPPKQYVIQKKIQHACDLLLMHRYSVAQIAEICNFTDVTFFCRQFRQYMGVSPTQYVKKYISSK